MSTTGKTFESLRETLQQTLDEKQRTEQQYMEDCRQLEQKYSEDCQRIEQNLAELKDVIASYTAELQSLGDMTQKIQSDASPEPLKQPQESISKPNDSFHFKLGGIGKIVWYAVGTILMFIVLFLLASLFEKPKETSQVFPEPRSIAVFFPSLVNSAEACVITGRDQERQGTADSLSVAEEQDVCDGPSAGAENVIEVSKTLKKREPRRPVQALVRSMIKR